MAENFKDMFQHPGTVTGLCSWCEKEIDLDQKPLTDAGWKLSHGICRRHSEKMYKTANIDVTQPSVKDRLDKITTRDLTDPKNAELVNWLKNPPPVPKEAEKTA